MKLRHPASSFLPLAVCAFASLGLALKAFAQTATPAPVAGPLAVRADLYHEGWIDLNKDGKKDRYEDSTAPIEERITDLLQQMTLDEKTCQLATLYGYKRVLKDALPTPSWKQEIWKDGIANIDEQLNGVPEWRARQPQNPNVWPASTHARAINEIQRWFIEQTRLGVPVDFTNEGIRGVNHFNSTNFPSEIGLGCTWDRELVAKIGHITGKEGRALGYTNLYSPVIDLPRDPRWGRVAECYSEDPYLTTELGVQQAAALQAEGVASTLKHYAVYGIPKGGRDGNARTDPHVGRREMEMLHLWPFEQIIRRVGVKGVMSSYNDYDGVPVSGSKLMLTDYLRTRFGFRGYVVSDSDAVRHIWNKHHVAADYKDASRQFLEAGGNVRTEFNPPGGFIVPVRELVQEGKLAEAVVDERVRDVLRVKFELGLFDKPYVEKPEAADALVHSAAHREVSLQAARESIVLLKNENHTLPLSKKLGSVLVCGPEALETDISMSRYGSLAGPIITILKGIETALPETKVIYEQGCDFVDARWPKSEILPAPPSGNDAQKIADAVKAAASVEAIILALGDSELTIGESKTRSSLDLPGFQNDLVRALLATGKPIVAVLLNGRPATVNLLQEKVPAIIEGWLPGEYCGQAIAEVLFGDYNPGGKLSITFPKSVGQIEFNFPARPGSQAEMGKGNDPNGAGNSLVVGTLYPFGFGLSYTTFEYSNLRITPGTIKVGGEIVITADIKNIGDRDGDEVVQVYVRDVLSSVITYEKVLRGFERVHLKTGEMKTVSFTLGARDLELLNLDFQRVVEPGIFEIEVAASSEDARLKGKFEVE